MKADTRAASAKCTPKTAELRKETAADASGTRRKGRELRNNCGKTAEQLRNLSSVSDPSSNLSTPATVAHTPTLARLPALKMPREVSPAEAPQPRGAARPGDAGRHTIAKRGRAWAVHDSGGELVALVLYRKGAAEVVRRLDAGAGGAP